MISFEQIPGPMVLWFDGEGRDCLLCDGPAQVIDYLMDEEGACWGLDGTREDLLECLNHEDNWTFNESGQPFQVSVAFGEISTFHVIVKCRRREPSKPQRPFAPEWVTGHAPDTADAHDCSNQCVEVTYVNGFLGWETLADMRNWKAGHNGTQVVAWREIREAFREPLQS